MGVTSVDNAGLWTRLERKLTPASYVPAVITYVKQAAGYEPARGVFAASPGATQAYMACGTTEVPGYSDVEFGAVYTPLDVDFSLYNNAFYDQSFAGVYQLDAWFLGTDPDPTVARVYYEAQDRLGYELDTYSPANGAGAAGCPMFTLSTLSPAVTVNRTWGVRLQAAARIPDLAACIPRLSYINLGGSDIGSAGKREVLLFLKTRALHDTGAYTSKTVEVNRAVPPAEATMCARRRVCSRTPIQIGFEERTWTGSTVTVAYDGYTARRSVLPMYLTCSCTSRRMNTLSLTEGFHIIMPAECAGVDRPITRMELNVTCDETPNTTRVPLNVTYPAMPAIPSASWDDLVVTTNSSQFGSVVGNPCPGLSVTVQRDARSTLLLISGAASLEAYEACVSRVQYVNRATTGAEIMASSGTRNYVMRIATSSYSGVASAITLRGSIFVRQAFGAPSNEACCSILATANGAESCTPRSSSALVGAAGAVAAVAGAWALL